MNYLSKLIPEFLKNPGDSFFAKVTKTGNQVIKIKTSDITRSAIRYPSTGTIVETIVHKGK